MQSVRSTVPGGKGREMVNSSAVAAFRMGRSHVLKEFGTTPQVGSGIPE